MFVLAAVYSLPRTLCAQAYFFTAEEIRRLMSACGFIEESVHFEERSMENKKENKVWNRKWLQAVFKKPASDAATDATPVPP